MFNERARGVDVSRALFLPCGQCVGCRLERSRQWAVRCMHESKLYDSNCFVTLTYSSSNLSSSGSLDYEDYQLFMKRLRARFRARIRFYMCGEYGESFGRPHFHSCLFNFDFPDKVYLCKSPAGEKLYRSAILEDLWKYGFSSVGAVTFESAAYVARYCVKQDAQAYRPRGLKKFDVLDVESGELSERVAEFNRMSLKPGIGAGWLAKFQSDVYPHGKVLVRGRECPPPRYYDQWFEKQDYLEYEAMQYRRQVDAQARAVDGTWDRLAVRETVAKARNSMSVRKL